MLRPQASCTRASVLRVFQREKTTPPAIMAPEMVRFNTPVDQRADIYALGCVAYWLLTHLRVFEAQNRADMLVMHAHQRPVPPSKRVGIAVPEPLEQLILQRPGMYLWSYNRFKKPRAQPAAG